MSSAQLPGATRDFVGFGGGETFGDHQRDSKDHPQLQL
jgi:hypothetical protein